MRQAATLLLILFAGAALAAASPSELLSLSYAVGRSFSAPRHGETDAVNPRPSSDPGRDVVRNAGRSFSAPTAGSSAPEYLTPPIDAPRPSGAVASLPARLEELLLTPEIALPAPVVASVPAATPAHYADLWPRIRAGYAMPDLDSPLVDRWQAWYLARPDVLKGILERSRRYLFHVVEEASRRGMPLELALLPMVESGYNPAALSPARASGLWQFVPSTARDYNLPLTPGYDARRDIVASTSAALDYLQDLYKLFGDWHLALAAYNWGEKSVAKAIEQNRIKGLRTDFASLALPEETRNYVPKLQALKNLIAYPDTFHIALEPIPNRPYFTTIASDRNIDLAVAARLSGVSIEELNSLNPGHNGTVVSKGPANGLVLPVEQAESFRANFESYKNANTPAKRPASRKKLATTP